MKRSPSILPSIQHVYSSLSQSMQPHSITDPPPNFTVPLTSLSLSPSPTLFQAHFLPSDPRWLILVSSDHTTLFQSSRVQSLYLITKSILCFLCFCNRRGLFFFTTAFIPEQASRQCRRCGQWINILIHPPITSNGKWDLPLAGDGIRYSISYLVYIVILNIFY